MRNAPDQQAYDRGTTIFSPNGRIYQVEYAREAVKQGSPVVGVTDEDGLVLAAVVSTRSALVETSSVEKLYTVDDHLVIGGAGHAADTRRLVDVARRAAQQERLTYDEPITATALATTIADHLHDHTQTGGARPYGSALLIGGFGTDPDLLEVDPSGSTRSWRANAIGRGADDSLDYFEGAYDAADPPADALPMAIAGLREADVEIQPGNISAVRIDDSGYESVSEAERIDAFEEVAGEE